MITATSLFAQTFEAKRDLMASKKKLNQPIISVGGGMSYMLNTLTLEKENGDCNCEYPNYIEDNNFVPNIFIQYRYNEQSDFLFRLSFSFNSNKILNSSTDLPPFVIDDSTTYYFMDDNRNIESNHYEIDFKVFYNVLSFKNIAVFAGAKSRFGTFNYKSERKYQINEFELLRSETVEYIDDNMQLAYLIGLSYFGTISNFNYNISFSYQSNFSNYTFDEPISPEFSTSNFGLSFNLYYDIIK